MISRRSVKALLKMRVIEAWMAPGYFIIQMIGIMISILIINNFISSIDTGGFNYRINPFYKLIGNALNGVFGILFMKKCFIEGPFVFAFIVSSLPVIMYLVISSVYHFCQEKKNGAVELFLYGPIDRFVYLFALFLKDVICVSIYYFLLFFVFIIAGLLNNLFIGKMFYLSMLLHFFLTVNIIAIGIFSAVLSKNPVSAIFLFCIIILFLVFINLSSYAASNINIKKSVSSVIDIINWISPIGYWNLGFRFIETGQLLLMFLMMFIQSIIACIILFISNLISKKTGISDE